MSNEPLDDNAEPVDDDLNLFRNMIIEKTLGKSLRDKKPLDEGKEDSSQDR